jgi:hypothetical protein
MPTIIVHAPRIVVTVLVAVGALLAAPGQANATIDPNETDRPKISAGDRDFGNNLFAGAPLNGGIVNWDRGPYVDRSLCPIFTPWISGQLYVNNVAWESTRIEVDYHDPGHTELHVWDSAPFKPVDNKSHQYTISDSVYGDTNLDHVIIKIQAFENGQWLSVGSAVADAPACY